MDLEKALSLDEIKKRVKSSFISLTARQILLRAIGFVSINLVLAKLLPVETIGIFNIATSIITFFAFFSDVGLGASLIQKKSKVEAVDIKTTFTIQLFLVGILSLVILAAAPAFGGFYKLDEAGVWLVRALGLSFFLSSLKVVPAVLLERELNFKPLVLVEIAETLVFNFLLIILVVFGFGLWAFSFAALVRGAVGVALIYILYPVRLGFGIDKSAAQGLLSFGLPYQINSILALIKDRLVPLVVARMVGPVGIGYITWSQALAFLPLEVMSVVIRITFPAFSRLQHDKKTLTLAIEKSLFLTSLTVYPLLFGIGAILPSLVEFVVSSKWQSAVPSFYLFAASAFWAVISTTFTNVLNAVGEIKTTLKLMVFWTVATWLLTPLLVFVYGFTGVGIASFVISFTSLLTIILTKRILQDIRVISNIALPLVGSLVMVAVVYPLSRLFVHDYLTLFVSILIGALVYLLFLLLFAKNRLLEELNSLQSI